MKIIILDRDGVLNKLVTINNELDSPKSIKQVEILPWVPQTLKKLYDLGYNFAIATNQPSLAKKTASYYDLMQVHNFIVWAAESAGAKILSSHICFHKAEDNCICRKPKTGLLQQIYDLYHFDKSTSWMIGDRSKDIIAGNSFNMNTVFIGDRHELATYNVNDLIDFYLKVKES